MDRKFWTAEKVRDRILELSRESCPPNFNHVQIEEHSLCRAAIRIFGSWKNAIETCGIEYDSGRIKRNVHWTIEMAVKEVKARHLRGLPITAKAVMKEHPALYYGARRLGGKGEWRKILEAAGFCAKDLFPLRKWTKEKVISEIVRLHGLEIPLNVSHLNVNGFRGLHEAGRREFGSWEKAVTASGIDYDSVKLIRMNFWSKRMVIAEIRRLNKGGVRLSLKSIQRSVPGLIYAALKHFGSWEKAVEGAGINYSKQCMLWSTKAWLRTLTEADTAKLQRRAETLYHLSKKHKRRKA